MSKDVRAGGAYVELGLRTKVEAGLKATEKRLRDFGKTAALAGGGMLGASAGMIAPLLNAASIAEDTAAKFDTMFGTNADAARAWAQTFAGEVGRSQQQIEQFMGDTQNLLIPLGIDKATATESSKALTKLAFDLASFNNKTDAEAMFDLQAAMTGSTEVMKKYGVVINQTGINQKLLNQGIDPKNATNAQKAQATLAMIMAGTTSAQGDAIAMAGSYANQMKEVAAHVSDLATTLGNYLLPPATALIQLFNSGAKAVKNFASDNATLMRTILYGVGAVGALGGVLLGVGTAALGASLLIPPLLSVMGFASAAMSAIFAPATVAVAAIAAVGVAAWLHRDMIIGWAMAFWDSIAPIRAAVGQIFGIVQTTFGGMSAAIYAADFGLAARILWAGVQAAFFTGAEQAVAAITWLWSQGQEIFGSLAAWVISFAPSIFQPIADRALGLYDYVADLLGSMAEVFGAAGNAIANGNLSLAFDILWASAKVAFVTGIGVIRKLWSGFTVGLSEVWQTLSHSIVSVFRSAMGMVAGVMQSAMSNLSRMASVLAEYDPTGLTGKVAGALGSVAGMYGDAEAAFAQDQRRADAARLAAQIANGQASLDAEQRVNADIAASRAERDALIAKANADSVGGISALAAANLAKLNALTAQADEAAAVVTQDAAAEAEATQDQAMTAGRQATKQNAGSFSAVGAALLGMGGGNIQDKIAKNTERTVTNTGRMVEAVGEVVDAVGKIPSPKFS